jgi:hypothetical protein
MGVPFTKRRLIGVTFIKRRLGGVTFKSGEYFFRVKTKDP